MGASGGDFGMHLSKPMSPSIFDNPVERHSPMAHTIGRSSGHKKPTMDAVFYQTSASFSNNHRLYA